jgi:peroxiredoxin
MAQLRQDYERFGERGAEVIVISPDNLNMTREYWDKEHLPFLGLIDAGSKVANLYRQEVKLLRFGRLPALLVVDKQGRVRYQHYASARQDIPTNSAILALLDRIIAEDEQPAGP